MTAEPILQYVALAAGLGFGGVCVWAGDRALATCDSRTNGTVLLTIGAALLGSALLAIALITYSAWISRGCGGHIK